MLMEEWEYDDTDEWEYDEEEIEEAIQAEAERERQARFRNMPAICQKCRWLDWYYTEECTHRAWPQNGRCRLFARDWHFRPHWLWLIWIRLQFRWWELTHWPYWREEKKRYMPLDWQHPLYNTLMWWRKVGLDRQVRAWLQDNGPERTVAYCMFHLNRQARYGGQHKYLIYRMKNHLVRLLYEQGFCAQTTLQIQRMKCWNCDGTGEDEWHDHEPCWKCDGTGVFRQHYLYRFVFDILGRRYVWHQPKSLVAWPVTVEMAGPSEYRSGGGGEWLDEDIQELYMMVVWEYLRQHSVSEKDIEFQFPTLRSSLRADWLNSRLRRRLHRRWSKIQGQWRNVKRLWIFAQTGDWPDESEEIPF
jgi:hypothetical protein